MPLPFRSNNMPKKLGLILSDTNQTKSGFKNGKKAAAKNQYLEEYGWYSAWNETTYFHNSLI